MKSIHDPKYSNIKALLQSSIREDVIMGIHLLKVEDFKCYELLWNFPNYANKKRDFPTSTKFFFWVEMEKCIIGVDEWVYAFSKKRQLTDWEKSFKREKITL